MTQPNDAERIIAAHREEGRKTRRLLVWLLVGIPVVAGVIAAAVLLANRPSSAAADSSVGVNDPSAVIPSISVPPAPSVAPPTTPDAIAQFTVTDSTRCSTISDWEGDRGTKGPLNPKDAAIYDGATYDGLGFDPVAAYVTSKGLNPILVGELHDRCTSYDGESFPDETAAEALRSIGQ